MQTETERPMAFRNDDEARAEFDRLLGVAEAEREEKRAPRCNLPAVLRDYEQVEGRPGLYRRGMTIETEARALELYGQFSTGRVDSLIRIGIGLAACVLFRVNLPSDEAEAREKILAFARGDVEEEEIFAPMTEREVGKLFKNSEELDRLVLAPLGYRINETSEAGSTEDGAAETGKK
jgi:hypothetical protein